VKLSLSLAFGAETNLNPRLLAPGVRFLGLYPRPKVFGIYDSYHSRLESVRVYSQD